MEMVKLSQIRFIPYMDPSKRASKPERVPRRRNVTKGELSHLTHVTHSRLTSLPASLLAAIGSPHCAKG